MAEQKSRSSRARRDSRRGHDKIKLPDLSMDPETGETHRRHHVTEKGYYMGKLIKQKKSDAKSTEDAEK